ncbi:hypothetical protein L1D14_04220 [Vibrio tubiashii]|uniref:hypothetical protein n=1 Tax=Vibrio tubiashii TaxID=29498 RepID=UPI001EFE62C0|nr:hypothetical protein [Vibrio tubiashii]MCG9575437.1 hypothetical protein [Vibrio tubiashii]
MFTNGELYQIATWCDGRGILPHRVVICDVKAACKSLNILISHEVSNEEINQIESFMQDEGY